MAEPEHAVRTTAAVAGTGTEPAEASAVDAPVEEPARGSFRRRMARHRTKWVGAGSIVLGLVIWEVGARLIFNPLFLPPLTGIIGRFWELLQDGSLWTNIAASGQAYLLGLVLAIVGGVVCGVAMAASRTVQALLDPWVAVFNSTPTIALAPLFIVIFGLGIQSKIAICALVMLFPILVNTFTGFATTDRQLVEAVRAFGASWWQIYTKVKLPMAVPYLVAGLRLSAAHGLVGIVVSELFGARAGIGLMIRNAAETFDSRALFVGIILLGAAGVAISYAVMAVERRVTRWRFTQDEEQ